MRPNLNSLCAFARRYKLGAFGVFDCVKFYNRMYTNRNKEWYQTCFKYVYDRVDVDIKVVDYLYFTDQDLTKSTLMMACYHFCEIDAFAKVAITY